MKSLFTNLLAGVALLVIAAAPALADSLFPAAGELWPNDYLHFFSTDMRPVQVTLRRDMFGRDGKEITITLPRAWITFASGYNPLKIDQLPNEIQTTEITIALADPTGVALSIRSREIALERHISLGDAIKSLRPELYYGNVSYVSEDIKTDDLQFDKTRNRAEIIEKDGLSFDPDWHRYLGSKSDQFFFAKCEYNLNPVYFCSYRARPGENLVLGVTFLDFRLHGGSGYANKRLSNFVGAFCTQVKPKCFHAIE